MPCKKIIVVTIYHLGADDFWDIWEALVLEHSLNVFLVLQKAPKSQRFCLFVVVLQLGESQVYTSDAGVKTVLSYVALEGVPKMMELGKDKGSAYEELMDS